MRVFISHDSSHLNIARVLKGILERRGLSVHLDRFDTPSSNDILSHLLYSVDSSDFVLLMVPPDFGKHSQLTHKDLDKLLQNKIKSRNVSIVPVYLGRRPVVSPFQSSVSFALDLEKSSHTVDRQLDRVAEYVFNVPRVNFERLTARRFEELAHALLKKLRLLDVERIEFSDSGFDISARSRFKNPFGGNTFVTWLIEVKFTRSSRVDVTLLHQLSHYLEKLPIEVNGVVITNGQLTSTAREWLEENARLKRTSVSVIDGTQLRELVLKYPDLVDEFFS